MSKVLEKAVQIDPSLVNDPPMCNEPGEFSKRYKAAKKAAREALREERKMERNSRKQPKTEEAPAAEEVIVEAEVVEEPKAEEGSESTTEDGKGTDEGESPSHLKPVPNAKKFQAAELDAAIKTVVDVSKGGMKPDDVLPIMTALLYCGTLIEPDLALGSLITLGQKEVANAIVHAMSGVKLFDAVSVFGLNEVVNMQQLKLVAETLPTMLDDGQTLVMEDTMTRITDIVKFYNNPSNWGKKCPKSIDDTVDPNEVVDDGVTSETVALTMAEAVLGKLARSIGAAEFKPCNDLVQLILTDTAFGTRTYYIDPDLIAGNGVNIFANVPNGTILVNQRQMGIIEKVLRNPKYILNPQEVLMANSDFFDNDQIYKVIDMSEAHKYNLGSLCQEDFRKLGRKLTFICNLPYDQKMPLGRLRIKNFESVDKFVLVSDKRCISPVDGCIDRITEGLSISVNGDKVSCRIRNSNLHRTYTIENYNLI